MSSSLANGGVSKPADVLMEQADPNDKENFSQVVPPQDQPSAPESKADSKPVEPELPPLSPSDFAAYNSMAQKMTYFHDHFKQGEFAFPAPALRSEGVAQNGICSILQLRQESGRLDYRYELSFEQPSLCVNILTVSSST
jgi:hypothetical protein